MEKDLDDELYKEYLAGNKEVFDKLYIKYRNRIHYFISCIVKDFAKAEDITQEVFMYVLNNEKKENYKFKNYIYLVAKSKAITYVNTEKRRSNINDKYFSCEEEKDLLTITLENEKEREILNAIDKLSDKYKSAIYLSKIEGMSYKETALIMGESIQNIKNLIHRGKKELSILLAKEGNVKLNRAKKIIIMTLCIGIVLSGLVYGSVKVYENLVKKARVTPTFSSNISTIDDNVVWVGTFNLVWNDLVNDVIKGPIKFEDGESSLADELNQMLFTTDDISEDSYYKVHGAVSGELKDKISEEISLKFNETSDLLEFVDWNDPSGYILYAMLKKEFTYLKPFPTLASGKFGNFEEKVKYFGIDGSTLNEARINIDVLFFNNENDFAVKLKTNEGEEVILYRTNEINQSLNKNYEDIIKKQNEYSGEKEFGREDIIKIPYINLKEAINYDELCGRYIKGTNIFIKQAMQTVEFDLNNYGGSVKSEALIETSKGMSIKNGRAFDFNDNFMLFLKEEGDNKPYLALKVENTNVLITK